MKKKHIAALAGIAAVFAVGGSLAYFNQDLEAVNVLKSGDFDTEIVEEFRPEDGKDWKPGTTVNKDFRRCADGGTGQLSGNLGKG